MDWKDLVKSVAPVLGTALGGPLGGLATKAISTALFGKDTSLEGAELERKIMQAINTDPDALLKLKQADQEFDTRMRELDIDVMRISTADRANARDMAIKTTLVPQIVLAAIYVVGFMGVLYIVFSGNLTLTSDQKDIAMYLLGILSAGLLQMMNFFFGSSSGSQAKNNLLSRLK